MTLSFTLTLDDHIAAHRLFRKPSRGSAREGPRLAERLLFFWILLGAIVVAVVCSMVLGVVASTQGAARADELGRWAGAILFPWMVWLLSFGFIWFMSCGFGGAVERAETRRLMLTLAFTMLAYLVISTAITGPPPAEAPSTTTGPAATADGAGGYVAALGPWLLILVFVFVFFSRHLRRAPLRSWTAQPHLHRPQTLEVAPDGLVFDDGACRRDYRWEGFTKFREGDTLFLLYVSEIAWHTVPKRAFAAPADVDGFRELLRLHVADVDRAVGQGFPVYAAAALPAGPPPLPTRPL
jgi:hypothetical protein